MNRLKQLDSLNQGWKADPNGGYIRKLDNGEAIRIVPAKLTDPKDKGWVVISLFNGQPTHANYYTSFKRLIEEAKS